MNSKIVFISILPTIFFTIGIIFLSYSSLTMSKVIAAQNEVFTLFFQELNKTNLLSAIITSFEYFFVNVMWIVLVFLLLMSCGFLIYLYYLKRVNLRVVIVSQIIMTVLVFVLSNFSIVILLTSLSLIVGTLWMSRAFEPEKKIFSTGYNIISNRIGLLSIFLSAGILITLIINMESYEEEMMQTNMDLIKNFVPDMSAAKEAQKEEIEQLTEGFKYVLSERYNYLSEDSKTECKVLYDGLTQSLDNYKQQRFQKIDEQELTVSEEDILQIFPFFNLIIKATPVIITISAYAVLAILTPVMGMFGGIVYSIAKGSSKAQGIQNKERLRDKSLRVSDI